AGLIAPLRGQWACSGKASSLLSPPVAAEEVAAGGLAGGEDGEQERPADMQYPGGVLADVAECREGPEHAHGDEQPENDRAAAWQEEREQEGHGSGGQDEQE